METNFIDSLCRAIGIDPNKDWRPVNGFPYWVSDSGDVVRIVNNRVCKLKQNYATGGYVSVLLYADGRKNKKPCLVHSLVLETFVGPRPNGYHACHNNGDKHDNRLSNLRWDTVKANSEDKKVHGTYTKGRQMPWTILEEHQVLEIRSKLGKVSQRNLAEFYGVSQGAIANISTGKAWGWLKKA